MIDLKKEIPSIFRQIPRLLPVAGVLTISVLFPVAAHAAGSPWENAVNALMVSFTGPIARGLSLVAIVWGGITVAFTEGESKRMISGIVFGVGMAVGAANIMIWLFS